MKPIQRIDDWDIAKGIGILLMGCILGKLLPGLFRFYAYK